MAIDKITPRFLVSDKDERLLQAGAMTDALNVTISEDGEGSEGVIKNVKGTIAGTAVAGSALTAEVGNEVTVGPWGVWVAVPSGVLVILEISYDIVL